MSHPTVVWVKVAHGGFEGRMSSPGPSSYFHVIQFFLTRSKVLQKWWERTGRRKRILLELVSCPNVPQRRKRGRFAHPDNGFLSPKETVHFRVMGAGEGQDVSVGTKPLSLLWLSYATLQCLFDNMYNNFRSFLLQPCTLAALWLNREKESTISPASIKAPHTHTVAVCHTWLTSGQHLLVKAEESEPLTVVGSSFILPCVLFSMVLDSST